MSYHPHGDTVKIVGVNSLTNGCNRNMSKSKGWTLQSSLLMLWMDEDSSQQQTKIAGQDELTITQ